MKSDNFQNSPKSAVEKIIDMIPTSADFAMVLTFNKGQKKEEAIDKILYALNVIEPEYAHRMPLANNITSANPLNESFNDALLHDNRFGNEDLKIVTTRV